MEKITDFKELTRRLGGMGRRLTVAVVCGSDESTRQAVARATAEGFVQAVFVGGDAQAVAGCPHSAHIPAGSATEAAREAVSLVRSGRADILMKGLVGSDVLLRAVLDKEQGLLPPGGVLTHLAVAEPAGWDRLLFFTDAAVMPAPTPRQRRAQVDCAVRACRAFGIDEPRVALIHCSEKVSEKFPHTLDYLDVKREAEGGRWGRVLIDGPLDLRTAIDAGALRVKGIDSPLQGRADVLVFPDIEAGNVFYKTLTCLLGATTACTLQGTLSPVVLPSRGDDADSKYYSLALAAVEVMAREEGE